MRLIIRLLPVLALLSSPAIADDDIYECKNRHAEGQRAQYSETCIVKQQGLIAELRSSSEKAASAIALAYTIAAKPLVILDLPDLTELRSGDTPIVPRIQRLYYSMRGKIHPGHLHEDTDPFKSMRSKYSDATTLRSFYDEAKQTIIAKIALASLRGMVGDALTEHAYLLDKPLPIAAALASQWYGSSCYEPEAEWSGDYQKRDCTKLKNFEVRFKETYGVEPTASAAYALGWLYRRHLEGGPQTVAVWQHIGKDLIGSYRLSQ